LITISNCLTIFIDLTCSWEDLSSLYYYYILLSSSIQTPRFFFTSIFSLFFRQIIAQVLSLEEEKDVILIEKIETSNEMDKNGTLLFIGEMFSRICRRGSAGN